MSLFLSLSAFATTLAVLFLHVRLFSKFPVSYRIPPGCELMTRYRPDVIDRSSERGIIFRMIARIGRDWLRMGCRRLWSWPLRSVWNYEIVGDGDNLLSHGRAG